MPAYDYHCETNGRTVEVSHAMTTLLQTWGELCDSADLDPGETPVDAPLRPRVLGAADRRQGTRRGRAAGTHRAMPAQRLRLLPLT